MSDNKNTVTDFCTLHRITMTAERADTNPHMEATSRGSMDHWKVQFTRLFTSPTEYHDRLGKSVHHTHTFRLSTYFSMGYGHNGAEPKAEDVLDCLASDASTYDNAQSFEDFARDLGYDEDSRMAEKTYKECGKSAAKLKQFLGEDLYGTLLYKTERQ